MSFNQEICVSRIEIDKIFLVIILLDSMDPHKIVYITAII